MCSIEDCLIFPIIIVTTEKWAQCHKGLTVAVVGDLLFLNPELMTSYPIRMVYTAHY
jgi:hypothetical protein